MCSSHELTALRERAIQLRREGKSRRQIKEILGPMSNATLNEALKGEPPPEWTRRPRAKDELRARARELRGVAGIVAGSNPLDSRTAVAPGRGFEPRFSAPKALVLPG